jgi:DNA ligase-1
MPDLKDGESAEMKGSGAKPYVLKNVGGVYSCTCPAWRNQGGVGIEKRSCKHLKKLRGEAAEAARCGAPAPEPSDEEEKPTKEIPPLLLAVDWDRVQDPTGWWMSEKLDGIRGYWDGRMLISRLGNKIHAPDWYTKGFPNHPMDGELWVKRKFFHVTNGMVRRQDQNKEVWDQIKFRVFDFPAIGGHFEHRYRQLENFVDAAGIPWLQLVEHVKCNDLAHLLRSLKHVEAEGGEGLMLREPESAYEVGRSQTLLKVKNFIDDEARVVGYNKGKGKFKGMCGSLQLELRSGVKFDAGTGLSDDQRRDPPTIGSIITVHYKELTNDGVPREPTVHGVRMDAKWGKKK